MKLKHTLELYKTGKITLMKVAEIVGISVWKMLDIVRTRKIPMHYTPEDVEKDIKSALKR